MDFKNFPEREFRQDISIPIIWGMILPFFIFDISIEIYHQTCFRLYKLPLVKRSKYIKIDRHKLEYLSFPDKIRCAYCGYANGFLAYAVKIVGDTEKYWCGIKHEKDAEFAEQAHHHDFLKYGDRDGFERRFKSKKNNQCDRT